MIEPNMKLLEVMRDEANLCYKKGDKENGNALVESIFAQIFPGLVEAAKNDPKIIYQLIIQAYASDGVIAEHSKSILAYLKSKGVNL